MEYLFSGNLLVVDLEKGEMKEETLSPEFISRYIGGARANLALYEEYKVEDPLIFGSGIFTATPVPGACLGVITGKSPRTGEVGHSPLSLYAGMELKLSGFDFVVLKGTSPKPVYLWIHDGLADILDAGELWELDTWGLVDELRRHIGEDLVQVLGIGEAGTKAAPAACVNINYWSSADRFGFGAKMGEKKVKALALRGLSMLDAADPQAFNERCLELHTRIRESGILPGSGFSALSPLLGWEDITQWLSGHVHRLSGCFACPLKCNTFVKYNEAPEEMRSTGVQEPGMLLTGLSSLLRLKEGGFSAEDAGRSLELASRLGLDPDAAAGELVKAGVFKAGEAGPVLKELASAAQAERPGWPLAAAEAVNKQTVFSPWAPFKAPGEGIEANWDEINALAYTFGLCPLLMLAAPFVNADELAGLLRPGAELDLDAETVIKIAGELLEH